MDDEVSVPVYYVVSQHLNGEQTAQVLHCLRITPVFCTIITDVHDAQFALSLGPEVIQAKSLEHAHTLAKKIAKDTGNPPLVVGDASFLDAIYSDGRREGVAYAA